MIRRTAMAVLAVGLVAQAAAGDVWDDLARYEYGDESKAGEAVETVLQETPVEEYGRLEKGLIRVVGDKDATQTGKAIACRMLQQVGSETCIPAVSTLLHDKVLSHYARLVLERLKSAKADAAMRKALDGAPDLVAIGLLGSLGERRDAEAVPLAARRARSSNPDVAAAGIKTLGKIGGTASAKALQALEPPKTLVPIQMQAMVACAPTLPAGEAAALCETVLAGSFSPARIAALRALASADGAKAAPRIAKAIQGDDAMLHKGALGIVAETKGEGLTRSMLDLLGDLPPDRKAGLVLALGSRGDKAALEPLTALIRSREEAVRDAAISAVGKLGDAGTVRTLLAIADSPALRTRVATAIARMTAEGIDAALVGTLKQPGLREAAIEASIARRCVAAVPALLDLVEADDAAVRKQAWAGLAALADADHMDALMTAVADAKEGDDLSAAEGAVKQVISRAEDKETCFKIVAAHFEDVPEATRSVILSLGPIAGGKEALELERRVLASGNKDLHGKALRALAAWPNASAAEALLKVARGADEKTDRLVALRGYIRIAGLETAKLSPAKRTEMLKTAMGLADRANEKKQVVAALQHAPTLEALEMLKAAMNNPALAAEGQMAAANLVWDLRTSHPDDALAVAQQLARSENRTVAKKARKTIADLSKDQVYIRAWRVSDVCLVEGKNGKAVHETVFPPEKDGKNVSWQRLAKGIGKETINLEQAVGSINRCGVYVQTTLVSPADQPVRLELGSDDGIKVWLNGKLVHDHWTTRPCRPGEDVAKADLKKGKNVLLLKVTNEGSHWAFSCRVTRPNGLPVEGLKVRPQ